jgi:tetratricopeptide (TPR) repeat protein
LLSTSFHGTFRFSLRSSQDGETLTLATTPDFRLGPGVSGLDVSKDGRTVAALYDDRVHLLRNTNIAYAALAEKVGLPGFNCVSFSPKGNLLAAANWTQGDIWIWHLDSREEPKRLLARGNAQLRFSPDGNWLAAATDSECLLWQTSSWDRPLRIVPEANSSAPGAVDFSPDSRWCALGWSRSGLQLLEMPSGRLVLTLESLSDQPLVKLRFSNDGRRIFCATGNNTVCVWDLGTLGEELHARGFSSFALPQPKEHSAAARARSLQIELGALPESETKRLLEWRREISYLTYKIRVRPDEWVYYRYRAELYQKLGEHAKAVPDYRRWIEIDAKPWPGWPLRDLARLLLFGPAQVSDYGEARKLAARAVALEEENPDNHFYLGVASYRAGDLSLAVQHLERALALWKPGARSETLALYYLAMSKASLGQSAPARDSLERAREAFSVTTILPGTLYGDHLASVQWEAEQTVLPALGATQ